MALRIRFLGPTGSTLGFSIERLSDGSLYDFSTSQFTSGTPATPTQSLPENTPGFPGQFKTTLSPTPVSQFTNGDYAITIVDQVANLSVGQLAVVMSGGDDATVIPGGPVASVVAPVTVGANNDKSGYALSQAFPSNFAGLAITSGGSVTAGTVADKSGYSITQAFPTNFASLTIDNSGRITAGSVADKSGYALSQAFPSNFAGLAITSGGSVTAGTVADKAGYSLSQAFPANFANLAIDSATGGMTVRGYASGQDPASLILAAPANKLATDGSGRVAAGTVADKSGYVLAAAGLDAIPVEAGINARQALAPILAASAGVVTGAGTGTIVIQGANGNASRIVANTDNAGNRLSVVLALPN